MTRAQQIFGDQFAGFTIVLREVEVKLDVHLDPVNYLVHKWRILDTAVEARPMVDMFEMASIIEEILEPWITYDREDLSEHEEVWNAYKTQCDI